MNWQLLPFLLIALFAFFPLWLPSFGVLFGASVDKDTPWLIFYTLPAGLLMGLAWLAAILYWSMRRA